MADHEAIGIATFLKVVIGPILLGIGLAYGIYRSKHGPIGKPGKTTSPYLSTPALILLAAGTALIFAAGLTVDFDMKKKAEQTGSATQANAPVPDQTTG